MPLYEKNNAVVNEIINLHNEILDYAIKVNQSSFSKYQPPSKHSHEILLPRSCLYVIGERASILHQSILCICENGWASTAPILLRSLLDCFVNTIVITNSDSEYWAFRYLTHDKLNLQIKTDVPIEVKQAALKEIDETIAKLNSPEKEKAIDYMNNFLRRTDEKSFWYKPEYRNTKHVLELCRPDAGLYDLFKNLSMSTHSSLIGMSMLKDKPDTRDINPRIDHRSMAFGIIESSTILLEIAFVRDNFEEIGLLSIADSLRKKKYSYKEKLSSL